MAISATDKEFLNYFIQLDEAQKKSLLELVKSFFKNDHEPMQSMSLEEYNRDLEEAEREIEAGHFTTQEELEKEMEKW
jgi:hypothetical protein